jgi:hypothetical protein
MMKEQNIQFISDARQASEVYNEAFEDSCFRVFTNVLRDYGLISFATPARYVTAGQSGLMVLGYSHETSISERFFSDEDRLPSKHEYDWDYTLFLGEFSSDIQVKTLKAREVNTKENAVRRYFRNAVEGKFLDDYNDAAELQQEIYSLMQNDSLASMKFIYITNGFIKNKESNYLSSKSFSQEIEIEYWDIEKYKELKSLKSNRVPINIDLKEADFSNFNIPCLKQENDGVISSYLSIFPGDFIADLYKKYHTRLLENNVRVFLSLRRKHNAGMAKTIENDPKMFFSYNNGLSATATGIEVVDNKIVSMTDFQIVNGGQTTATLFHSRSKKKLDLKDVFVQVKLTKIDDLGEYSSYISDISKYSNSQTAIRKSDFYTNDPFLISLEKITQELSVNKNGLIGYYFFERMGGQYQETRNKQGTKSRIKVWESKFQKNHSFNKIDFARWSNVMILKPYLAASGAEKQFEDYMKSVEKPELSSNYVKTLIGFGMLFNRARKVCGRKRSKEFPSIIDDPSVGMSATIYAMAYLHYYTNGSFDYHVVFDKHYDVDHFDQMLKEVILGVWSPMVEFGGLSVQEQSKKIGCWDVVRSKTKLSIDIQNSIQSYCLDKKAIDERTRSELVIDFEYFMMLDKIMTNDNVLLSKMSMSARNFYKQYIPFVSEIQESFEIPQNVVRKVALQKLIEFKNSIREFKNLNNDRFNSVEKLVELDTDLFKTLNDNIKNNGGLTLQQIESVIALNG